MNGRTLALCSIIAIAAILGTGLISRSQDRADDAGEALSPITPLSHSVAVSPTDAIWDILGRVNRNRIVNDLHLLAGEQPICTSSGCYTAANRLTGSEGLRWAMDYIYEVLVGLDYAVDFRDWSHSGKADRNLIARKVGVFAPGEQVLFVAHVDGVQKGAEERFPAADDNASGAVDLLETARVLSTYSFSRTLVLLFTTGEEQGSLGSRSYVDQLPPEEFSAITVVVNVDMVGYDANGDGVMELWHGDHSPSVAVTQTMSETINAYEVDLTPRIIVGCG